MAKNTLLGAGCQLVWPWAGKALCPRKLRTGVRGKPPSDVTQKTVLLLEVSGLSSRDFWVSGEITDLHTMKDKYILRCHGASEALHNQSMRLGNERHLHFKDKALPGLRNLVEYEKFSFLR